ncbi:MAG: patatin-like phospholipase family protein [Proteobacteria bacterium]|nr:patatin-like phospholipase family protein [Pseudomonadota bacterium]
MAFILCSISAASTSAAAPPDGGRPKVGLVLGGGGARGAAHIGVLRELERMRIPIDAIAGTSMGAIVGGLYATGISASELEELFASLDWVEVLTDAPGRKYLSFRRKQDDEQFPIKLELGLRDGELLVPKGVIQGQKLGLLLRKLTLGASSITDFDELPIPFRAVASDIERGEAYVIGHGDLAQAIRASLSVPGVLAPVRFDDRWLVDGGLVGNLPIDIMQEMGVDIIIAVDVQFPLYPAEELQSAVTISEQMLTILMRKESLRQIERLGEQDILIRPDLGLYGSTNFSEIAATIEPGANATRAMAGRLRQLAVEEAAYVVWLAKRAERGSATGTLDFVRVIHDSRLAPEVLESRLHLAAGDPVDAERLEEDVNRLYGLQLFESVSYRLVTEEGRTGVQFDARSKSWGPNYLQFGVSLEDDFEGSTGFNLAVRLTRTGLNRLGAEWRTDLQVGTDPALVSEYYQPLSFDSRVFLAPKLALRQFNLNAFVMNDRVATLRISSAQAGIDMGTELGAFGEFRIGAYRGIGEARVKVGDPALPNIDFETGGVFARLRIDTLDNARFPRHGVRADVTWNLSRPGLGADFRFDTIAAELASTWSLGKNSLQIGLSYATTIDSDDTIQNFFPLGGFWRLSGLERGAISGPHAALTRLVYYRRVGSGGGLFDMPFYLGASVEAGNVWQRRSDIGFNSMLINGSLFAGMDTFFGPLYLAAGFAEGGHTNFYLFLGAPPR